MPVSDARSMWGQGHTVSRDTGRRQGQGACREHEQQPEMGLASRLCHGLDLTQID